MRPILFAAALVMAVPALSAPLDDMLAYPFTSELVASADGSRIAWVREVRGVRNILVADAGGTPVSVTAFADDDGQELTQLSFSPDGKALWFVRGGDHDGNWPAAGNLAPNPTGAAAEPKVTIWRADAGKAASAAAVTEGDAPSVAATGRLAYLKDGQVWTAEADGKNARRLFFDRGKNGQLAWSPDGTRLAFVSRRESTAYIGLWQDGQPIRFLAPSSFSDGDPTWSPDGTRIAFTRRAAPQSWTESLAEPKADPWRIMLADAASGTARLLWRSGPARRDSYPDVLGGANLTWAGGKLVFLSAQSNWQQLYALDPAGGAPVQLTPGNFMVEHVAPAGDGRHILYSGNAGDQPGDDDRRHVFRVAASGGRAEALTSGTGIEWAPVGFAGGAAFIGATAQAPPAVMRWQVGTTSRLGNQPVDAAFPERQLVTPQPVTWKAPDGLTVHGQLFARPGAGKRPAVIFVHGGPPRQMLLGWSYMRYYSNAYALNQYLASRGFVVLSVNFRLGIGYGFDFQHPDKGGPAGASEYQDVLSGAKWLQSRPDVDPARIGIWGGSYGGLLTAQALGRNSDVFKAGVDIHGVHDWSLYIAETDTRAEGHERPDRDAILATAWKSSPVADLAGWRSPALLIHGDDDRNVRIGQTVDLARRLDARGMSYEELVIPNEIHDFLRHEGWRTVDAATAEFLERQLKP